MLQHLRKIKETIVVHVLTTPKMNTGNNLTDRFKPFVSALHFVSEKMCQHVLVMHTCCGHTLMLHHTGSNIACSASLYSTSNVDYASLHLQHSIFLCPFLCHSIILLCICFIDSGNLWHKRVIWIGVT